VAEPQRPADALGLVGTVIDQIRFDACVDAGGFGLIYRGFHEGLSENVAIKCLRIAAIQRTDEAMREALAGRFRDETKLLYRLSQGNLDIVRCISSGSVVAPKTKEYTPYMVLEWLDGCTLSTELRERRERMLGPRSLGEAVKLLDSAASAIAYAHSHDVVHRDVKPGNLFLTRTREGVRMKVLDFGLAKIISDEAIGIRPSVETGIGVHFCSPSYGAPEQYSGQVGKIGPATDVYSLCLVLYEIMLGVKVRPAGSLAEGLIKALNPTTGSPSASSLGLALAPAVEALLQRALAQNPLERPRDAGVFWGELKEAMKSGPAMQRARDAAVLREAAARPSPFAGTMLMHSAPGASSPINLVVPLPAPIPAAGLPTAPGSGSMPLARGTSPLAPPMGRPGSSPPASEVENGRLARERDERMNGTFGATSPLAASMVIPPRHTASASGPPPIFASANPPANPQQPNYEPQQQPHQQQQQPSQRQQQSQQPQLQHQRQAQQQQGTLSSYPPDRGPRARITTDPRILETTSTPVPKKAGALGLMAIVVTAIMLALLGGAYCWLRMHGQ
jgi:serine/threonine-protein kinase